MTLTALQFAERLKNATADDSIVVYVPASTRRDTYNVKSVKGHYIYIKQSVVPVHFDHVEELHSAGETWKRR